MNEWTLFSKEIIIMNPIYNSSAALQIGWKHLAVFIVADFLFVITRKHKGSVLDPNRPHTHSSSSYKLLIQWWFGKYLKPVRRRQWFQTTLCVEQDTICPSDLSNPPQVASAYRCQPLPEYTPIQVDPNRVSPFLPLTAYPWMADPSPKMPRLL